jgi:hypothetical protein
VSFLALKQIEEATFTASLQKELTVSMEMNELRKPSPEMKERKLQQKLFTKINDAGIEFSDRRSTFR